MNYLKGHARSQQDQEPKTRRKGGNGPSESRTGSPNPRQKRARKEFRREQIEIQEPSHRNSRTEHPELFRGFSRREISPKRDEHQVRDELDLLLDLEADKYIASPFVPDI